MKEKMEHRVWSAIGSVALCLGSETRRRRDCCWTRCGGTESTVDNMTGDNCMRRDATSEISLLVALAIDWCMPSHCMGFLVLETMPRECDTFLLLAGVGAVPIMILADLKVIPHLSLAVRSAIDLGRWTDCNLLRHVLRTRVLGGESIQCLQIVLPSTHFIMSAWWEPLAHLLMFLLLLCLNWRNINSNSCAHEES